MATIKDVAQSAGVSISTVSKFLNGGNVLPEYAEPIRKAIADLDYRVNPYARNLKTPRKKFVGVLLPNIALDFFGSIITSLDRVLRSNGYHIVTSCYNSDHGLERDYLAFLLGIGIDGLVYMPENLSEEEFLELTEKHPIPIVQADRLIPNIQSDAVLTDNTDASYEAVSKLAEMGHTRIALLSGPSSILTARERMVGYLRALSDHHIPYDDSLVIVGDYTFTCGYQSLQTLLELPDPPTAVFCINYDMSLGLITAAQERGLKLPEQLNIFSYDCIEICSLMSPPLSVVHQPAAQIGQTAGAYLLERLNGYDGPPRTMRLKSQVIF